MTSGTSPSRGLEVTVSGDIIDLRPLIRRKQQAICKHVHVTVSFDAADLTCDDCDAKIDPWWYIRRLCEYAEELQAWRLKLEQDVDAKIENGNRAIVRMNETITRLNAEISRLTDVKNNLSNESVGGRLVGHAAARPRRSRKK